MLWHSEVIGDFVKSIFSLVQEGDHFLAETDVSHCLIQISFSLKTRAARSKKNIYILPQYCTQSFFWAYRYMYRDWNFNESIGERTVRQTDQQKLQLYLAAFRC